jgi:hypothetical protein
MKLNLLDKVDYAIFKRVNPNHQPSTGATVCMAFVASVVFCLIIFVCQMCNVNDTALNVIAGVGLTGILGWMVYASLGTINAFDGWGGKIGYAAYTLVLGACAFYLAMWATVIILAGLVIFGIAKVFFGPKKKGIIRYSDGTEEEADIETGICGEETFTGRDSGNSFTRP